MPSLQAMVVMEDSPVRVTVNPLAKTTANRAMEDTAKTQRAALLLIIQVDMAPTMDSPSQDMGLSLLLRAIVSPISRIILEATVTAASLHRLRAEATTSSPLSLAITSIRLPLPLALVTMATTPSHLAMDSSSNRVGVVMEVTVGGNLEHMGAVEDRAVDTGGVEANNSPLNMEVGLTTHLTTTALLLLRTTGNKVSTDRESTVRILHP